MFRRFTIALLLVVLVLSVAAVYADEDTDTPSPVDTIMIETEDYGDILAITDGRLNGTDVAAPVAVYPVHRVVTDPEDGHPYEIDYGYQVLAVAPKTNNGYLVLEATIDDIHDLMMGVVDHLESNGYTLNYSASDYFWVSAPADKEGKVYTFQWQNHEFPLPQ